MRIVRPGLTLSILASLGCLLLLTWMLFSLFALRTAANDLYTQKGHHARMLVATFISQLPETIPLFPNGLISSATAAATYSEKLAENADFVRLTLLDANDKCIYTVGKEGVDVYAPFAGLPQGGSGNFLTPDGTGVSSVIQVLRNGSVAGRTGLVMSLSAEKGRLDRSQQLFMAYFAIDFILLLGFGSFILSRIVVRPISRLLVATEKITDGHYGHRIRVSGSSELARLAESFNSMSETLLLKDRQVAGQVAALERANLELRQAREETLQSEKMASIGLLAAGMAHEIGTPLASVMGYAELLTGEHPAGSASHDYARRIAQDSVRIDRIVRGLLDYSRSRTTVVEPVDVGPLVLRSIELLSQQGAFKGINITTRFDEMLPPAEVDPHQLQQVLINLMLNSRDAMPEGGQLSIYVKADDSVLSGCTSGSVRIDVMDSGSGIPDEIRGKLFDPFFTTKQPGKGTGLGLAISARIIDGFGGRIMVKSTVGRGSCFSLLLPITSMEGRLP